VWIAKSANAIIDQLKLEAYSSMARRADSERKTFVSVHFLRITPTQVSKFPSMTLPRVLNMS